MEFTIPARDGFALAATRYRSADAGAGLVLVSSATAVPRRYYRHFAKALAARGFEVLTYDYRGIGGSRPASLRGFDAKTRDWALLDMAGVVDYGKRSADGRPLYLVGHSVGGQIAGLLDNGDAIAAMVTVSAQSGYWRMQIGEQKAVVMLHVYLTLPLLATVFGYMPWSWFSSAEDLPKGAALEWSRWCRHPDYLLGDKSLPLERYAAFEAPVLAYSIADDKWGSRKSVDAMMHGYPSVERRHIEPSAAGVGPLGHFGFFRPTSAGLWEEIVAWLRDRPPSGRPSMP